MFEDIGLKFYGVPSSWVMQGHRLRNFMLKFFIKVFRSLYLLNMLMDQVDTLHVGRYWSEVLCNAIMVHPG